MGRHDFGNHGFLGQLFSPRSGRQTTSRKERRNAISPIESSPQWQLLGGSSPGRLHLVTEQVIAHLERGVRRWVESKTRLGRVEAHFEAYRLPHSYDIFGTHPGPRSAA